jgi:hypothetical protein
MNITAPNSEPMPASDESALFQVGDEQPAPMSHLMRVNAELTPDDVGRMRALRVGKALELAHDGHVVRVRRTR